MFQDQSDEEQYIMTFGKFKGRTLKSLAEDKKDRTYLEWMLQQDFHEKFKHRIEVVLRNIA